MDDLIYRVLRNGVLAATFKDEKDAKLYVSSRYSLDHPGQVWEVVSYRFQETVWRFVT